MGVRSNPIIFLTEKLWNYSKGNRHNVILYALLSIIGNVIGLFEPLIIAKVLNIIQETGINKDNMYTIIWYISSLALLWGGFWFFHGPSRVIEMKNAFMCRSAYKKYLIDGTLSLSPEWHTNHHSGDTIDKIEKGTAGLYEYCSHTFEVIGTIIKLVFSYFVLAYFNIHSAYIVAALIIITITVIIQYDKILIKQYKELFRRENKISEKIYDIISNITTVIILRIEKLVSSSIYKRIIKPFKLFSKNTKLNELKWFTVSVLSSITIILVLITYIYSNAQTGTVLAGTVFVLYGYLMKITNIFFHFAYRYGDIVKWRTQVSNVEEISNQFEKIKKPMSEKLDTWQELKVKNLKFSYHSKKEDLHLDNISLIIKNKERIALIGDSGSGKTTLLKVIRDLYHPRHVTIYLDNKWISNGFAAISKQISLIPQDPEIFTTTIKENITLGVSRTMKEIKKFTDLSCFTNVANKLPNKFNSSIVEKGVNLSGGEKQRLALARGLMASANKRIILLDEATSSVDMRNELNIYQNIFKTFKDKTIIASIHRLHLLNMFNKIYFFKNGKIIASGTLKQILKNKEFKKNWDKYKAEEKRKN